MSVKVLKLGDVIEVENPVTGGLTQMQNVVFIEEGRSGADLQMSESSRLLSDAVGTNVGLDQLRTHTHPVKLTEVQNFPPGTEFKNLHINRGLYSTPQIRQQIDKDPRVIDGKPTFFKTWISDKPEEDVDYRLSIDVLANWAPGRLMEANVGAANVRTVEKANAGSSGSAGSSALPNRTSAAAGQGANRAQQA
jgi:hypothetical protein